MPVAMISTSTSPGLGPFEVKLDDLQRLLRPSKATAARVFMR
jgi:hypothetical protein